MKPTHQPAPHNDIMSHPQPVIVFSSFLQPQLTKYLIVSGKQTDDIITKNNK